MRSAFAMNTVSYIPPAVVARLAEMQREQDRLGWHRQVADYMTATGTRCLLEHVSAADWDAHFDADEDAYSAVVSELEKVEG